MFSTAGLYAEYWWYDVYIPTPHINCPVKADQWIWAFYSKLFIFQFLCCNIEVDRHTWKTTVFNLLLVDNIMKGQDSALLYVSDSSSNNCVSTALDIDQESVPMMPDSSLRCTSKLHAWVSEYDRQALMTIWQAVNPLTTERVSKIESCLCCCYCLFTKRRI